MSLCTEKTITASIGEQMLPQWPQQEKISLVHKKFLDCLFFQQKTLISEHSFSGLFLFADVYGYCISKWGDAVIITGKDTQGLFAIFPAALPSPKVLQQLQQHNYYFKTLSYKKKKQMQETLLPIDMYRTVANEGDFDYMYKRSNLQILPGRKFHKKRNLINQFMHKYTQHKTEDIVDERLSDVLYVLQKWVVEHANDTHHDYPACKKAIKHYKELGLIGQITYVDNIPVGFVIGELRNNKTCAVIHFEKGDSNYIGIYQYINQKFANGLPKECTVINREQDLGKEGLRQAKMTYRPTALLKKYRVYFHGNTGRD